jgi:hypothetical protein
MIYDYLFFKSYQLGKRSRNFEDIPVLAGVIWVGACLMFNIFTVVIFLDALGYKNSFIFDKKYKYIFSLSIVLILIFSYSFRSRYKKIIDRYEENENKTGKSIHPVFVISVYYIVSFALLLLAGMFKNGDGVFK